MERRQPNYTYKEKALFLELMEEAGRILIGKNVFGVNPRRREDAWETLAVAYNKRTVVKRTVSSLRKFWDNAKRDARKYSLGRTTNDVEDPLMEKVIVLVETYNGDTYNSTDESVAGTSAINGIKEEPQDNLDTSQHLPSPAPEEPVSVEIEYTEDTSSRTSDLPESNPRHNLGVKPQGFKYKSEKAKLLRELRLSNKVKLECEKVRKEMYMAKIEMAREKHDLEMTFLRQKYNMEVSLMHERHAKEVELLQLKMDKVTGDPCDCATWEKKVNANECS